MSRSLRHTRRTVGAMTIRWRYDGDLRQATLDGNEAVFARITSVRGGWRLQWMYGPSRGRQSLGMSALRLMKYVDAYVRHHEAYLRSTLPPPRSRRNPYALPVGREQFFYDAFWPGYNPSPGRGRHQARINR